MAGVGVPVFGEPVGAGVLFGSAEQGWRLLDLDSGRLREVPALDGVRPDQLFGVRDGVVVLNDDPYGRLQYVQLPAVDPGDRSLSRLRDFWPDTADLLVRVVGVLDAGLDDRVWVVTRSARAPDEVLATLVGLDGQRLIGPITLPAQPAAATSSGLVYEAGGRSYLVDVDGVRDLGFGGVFAGRGSLIGRVVCNADARCVPEVVDLSTGAATQGSELSLQVAATDGLVMAISASGALAVTPSPLYGPQSFTDPPLDLQIVAPGLTPVTRSVRALFAPPVWLPDDSLLLATGYGLFRYRVDDGFVTRETVPGLRPRDETGLVVISR